MRKFVKELGITLFSLIFIFWVFDIFYTYTIKHSDYKKNKAQFILNKKHTKTDYVILGSSRAFNSISTKIIDADLKTFGLNLGVNGTGLAENALLFKEFIKNNNSTELLLIELSVDEILNEKYDAFSFPEYLPYIDNSKIYNAFKQLYGKNEAAALKYAPFYKYAKYNSFWRFQDIFTATIYSDYSYGYFDEKGNYYLPKGNFKCSEITDSVKIKTFKKNKYLNELEQLCNQNGIRIIYYTAPYYNLKIEDTSFEKLIQTNVDTNRYAYFNFIHLFRNQKQMFRDCGHINENGAVIITDSICNIMKTKYF